MYVEDCWAGEAGLAMQQQTQRVFFFLKLETPKEQKTAFVFTPARTESTPKFLARHSEAMANCILTFCSELKAETQIQCLSKQGQHRGLVQTCPQIHSVVYQAGLNRNRMQNHFIEDDNSANVIFVIQNCIILTHLKKNKIK